MIRKRMHEIAQVRFRYGFWRIFTLLRREGWPDNHKRVHRLYREEGLNLRSKRPRKARLRHIGWSARNSILATSAGAWILWLTSSSTHRKIRCLPVVDNYSRQCPGIQVGQSLKGEDVVAALEKKKQEYNVVPKRIQVGNGSEFISKGLDKWAYENKGTLDFSSPGNLTDNTYIVSFNGSFRDECLNVTWFLSIEDARDKMEAWR